MILTIQVYYEERHVDVAFVLESNLPESPASSKVDLLRSAMGEEPCHIDRQMASAAAARIDGATASEEADARLVVGRSIVH